MRVLSRAALRDSCSLKAALQAAAGGVLWLARRTLGIVRLRARVSGFPSEQANQAGQGVLRRDRAVLFQLLVNMVWLDSVRLRSSSPRTRRKAIENLTGAGNLRGLKLLIASLADEDREVRCAAAKALAVINQELSVAARVAALGDGKVVSDTSTATALNAVQDPRRSKSTMTTMKTMKFTAISAPAISPMPNRLTELPAPTNGASHAETATLLEDLGDPDVRVRLPAAQALEQIANPAHLNHFLALMADDNFEVRLAAVHFMRRLGDPVLAQALLPRLADPDSDVRLAAAQALGAIRNPAAVEPLVLALTDEEQAVRQAVVAALEQIDGRWIRSLAAQRAVPRLDEMRKDPRPWVGAAAEKVLEKLRAANGKDTEVWKRESGIRQL